MDLGLPPTVPFLDWAWDDLIFIVLAGIMLGAALFVVIGRDIVRSGLAMMLSFAALAGIYALAGAVIVAAAQVLIYIGAISILILFAIMLTQTKSGPLELVFHRQAWAGALAAIGVALLLIISVVTTQWPLSVADRLWSSTTEVALLLFHDPLYVFSLQVIAVLLTAAVIGGVFLAKREGLADPGEREATEGRVRPTSNLERLPRPANVDAAQADQAASDGRSLSERQESTASRAAGADAGGAPA